MNYHCFYNIVIINVLKKIQINFNKCHDSVKYTVEINKKMQINKI